MKQQNKKCVFHTCADARRGPSLHQQRDQASVARGGGEVQGGPAVVLLTIHLSAMSQQKLHCLLVTHSGGKDQGSPASGVVDVHVGAVLDGSEQSRDVGALDGVYGAGLGDHQTHTVALVGQREGRVAVLGGNQRVRVGADHQLHHLKVALWMVGRKKW